MACLTVRYTRGSCIAPWPPSRWGSMRTGGFLGGLVVPLALATPRVSGTAAFASSALVLPHGTWRHSPVTMRRGPDQQLPIEIGVGSKILCLKGHSASPYALLFDPRRRTYDSVGRAGVKRTQRLCQSPDARASALLGASVDGVSALAEPPQPVRGASVLGRNPSERVHRTRQWARVSVR